MPTLIYIHGFNSSPQSHKAGLLREWLAQHRPDIQFIAPDLNIFPEQVAALLANLVQQYPDAGLLGSMDANRGDYQNGWDTDQFPNNINELIEMMLVIIEAGGFRGGGINFDAKIRRNSSDAADLFHAHIGGIDSFARALIAAEAIMQRSDYKKIRAARYASFDSGKGKEFEDGKLSLEELRNYAIQNGEPAVISGKQEYVENIINRFI